MSDIGESARELGRARMLKSLNIHPVFFLIVATTLEVCGDATIRIALYDHPRVTLIQIILFAVGAMLVFGYAVFLNLAPLEFREVVGLYIATLFIVWQVINLAFFRTLPTPPILIGGTMIVIGGLVVSLWPK